MTFRLFYSLLLFTFFAFSCTSEDEEVAVIEIDVKFEAERTLIFSGDMVQFMDKSTGNPTEWAWEFFGGTPSSSMEKNPIITYEEAGSYSVGLSVSNSTNQEYRRLPAMLDVRNLESPPYEGTVWFESNIITQDDKSLYESLVEKGQEIRLMYDRRTDEWLELNAHVFTASYADGKTVDMQVNPEFDPVKAKEHALTYAPYIGQLPAALTKDLEHVTIHDGNATFGGGNNGIEVYVESGNQAIQSGHIEELLLHEAAHVSLQDLHNDQGWKDARTKDPTYISTYARDNPIREDVSESIVPYIAFRFRPQRISEDTKYIISRVMPNRITFFDEQNYDFSIYQ